MDWSTDVAQLNSWAPRLQPFTDHCVGSIVPAGFEAVGRLFHPIQLDFDKTETWTDVAERNGRIVHPQMQLHAIGGGDCWEGELGAHETTLLSKIVARHTTTPDGCWFGVWEGYGQLHTGASSRMYRRRFGFGPKPPPEPGLLPDHVAQAGPADLHRRSRPHYLLRGALSDLDQARTLLRNQTPNLWWPEDRSWFVATEIDFCWTLIGGTSELIEELMATDGLEVLRSGYDHRGTYDSDQINTDQINSGRDAPDV